MSRGGFWYTTDDVVGYTNDTHIFKYTATTKVVGHGVVIKLLAGASRPCKEEVKTENAIVVWSSTALLPLAFDKCSACCGCRLRTRTGLNIDVSASLVLGFEFVNNDHNVQWDLPIGIGIV